MLKDTGSTVKDANVFNVYGKGEVRSSQESDLDEARLVLELMERTKSLMMELLSTIRNSGEKDPAVFGMASLDLALRMTAAYHELDEDQMLAFAQKAADSIKRILDEVKK